MGEDILARTSVGMDYKPIRCLRRAAELIQTDERWANLRFLIVSYTTVMGAIDPQAGTISSVSSVLLSLKAKYEFKRYPLIVIGVSANDMFGKVLSQAGCDLSCSNEQLHETIVDLSQPGSGNLKLPS